IFVQNQGMRKILPQAYNGYSEDKILSITPSLGEKIVLQKALKNEFAERTLSSLLWEGIIVLGLRASARLSQTAWHHREGGCRCNRLRHIWQQTVLNILLLPIK
ncbi:MAG: hypothetical protein V2I32_07600, partial [Desulforhopalus sp.]|nr:hypothetical protein [Desulforhopalus sp.]